jgi:hypothetical protein
VGEGEIANHPSLRRHYPDQVIRVFLSLVLNHFCDSGLSTPGNQPTVRQALKTKSKSFFVKEQCKNKEKYFHLVVTFTCRASYNEKTI